ncbi:LysM peptidoglycan-binding domain-containing protein [Bacteroides heparinolyticus]|uniref:LysM peptidoglycan-binding domain-containing protein n=1 Tax=Prevotella heparinolytica TaxID=28113 RepID=UPI00359FBA78
MRTQRRKSYKRNTLLINICIIIILVFFIGFFLGRTQLISRAGQPDGIRNISYISIQISSGDTLESIAREYNNTGQSNRAYMENIKKINKLQYDKIYAGSYLIVARHIP